MDSLSSASEPSPELFQTVAKVGEIPDGEGRAYVVNGRMVAVFCVGGEYHALADACPHMGASLASGYVEGDTVTCPWHAWRFCTRDGTWLDNPKSRVKTDAFRTRVCGDEVQVCVPAPPPRGAPGT
jgi:nitrite reductase (NADH) small subunit